MKSLASALTSAGLNTFQDRRDDSKARAQDCLSGITHYVDDATLHFFKARILSAQVLVDGLFFGVIESSSADFRHTSRIFRPVIFDVFGTVIYRPDLENSFRTRAAAEKDFRRAVEALTPAEHYAKVLEARAARLTREAADLRDIAKGL